MLIKKGGVSLEAHHMEITEFSYALPQASPFLYRVGFVRDSLGFTRSLTILGVCDERVPSLFFFPTRTLFRLKTN